MSRKRKLYEKMLNGSKNIRFGDLITVILAFGFVLDRTRGSHKVYKHPKVADLLLLQEANSGQAKSYQIEQFLDLVEKYDLTMNESPDTESED